MSTTQPAPSRPAEKTPWLDHLHPGYRLVLRWAYVAIATVIAFHATLASVLETLRKGGINSFVVVAAVAAILAAIGVARRDRTELPIHDRQTDIIAGSMGLVLAVLLQAVLLERYTQYFHLLRLDLLALWIFVFSSSIVLFGLRPVYRFRWVWGMLLLAFPLPYQIVVILLGGSPVAAGAATLMLAAVATGIAVGRTSHRGWRGSGAALGVGFATLAVMALFVPNAPLIAFQLIPALTAIVLVCVTVFIYVRRGEPKRILDRQVAPPAAARVWAGLPLVLIVAVALSFVRLPSRIIPPPTPVDDVRFGAPLIAPAGWHLSDTREYDWVARIYGPDAHLIRQMFVANEGNPQWDKYARPRAIVVDSVTTARPFSFQTIPANVLYPVSATRQSHARLLDLGHGVTGALVSVVDDDILVTWNAIQWTWTNGTNAQQVRAFAVDNHEPDAPFPAPTGALLPTLNTLFNVLFRGNSVAVDTDPSFKDAPMLTEFSTKMVTVQRQPSGSR